MLNPIEEAKFEALRKNCKELGLPAPPEIHINFEVKDKDGNIVFVDRQRGHSWTRNFYNALFGMVSDAPGGNSNNFGAGYMSVKRTAGTNYYNPAYTACRYGPALSSAGFVGQLNDATYGIVVGTGDTAFSTEHTALITPVVSGSSAGQLSYLAQSAGVISYDNTSGAEKWTNTFTRLLNNNSGGAITIKEIGLIYQGTIYTGGPISVLFERSVLSPTVGVPNGAQLTLTYEISMSFAAID